MGLLIKSSEKHSRTSHVIPSASLWSTVFYQRIRYVSPSVVVIVHVYRSIGHFPSVAHASHMNKHEFKFSLDSNAASEFLGNTKSIFLSYSLL